MNVRKGLEILVEDWINLHEEGGTPLSVEGVISKLGLELDQKGKVKTAPTQLIDLLENYLRQKPTAWKNVEKFMAQFEAPGDLLEEIDLDCLVSDLKSAEDDVI